MIRTAGCKNTVSVHRRLSSLYRLRAPGADAIRAWARPRSPSGAHHERLHVMLDDLSINIDRGACRRAGLRRRGRGRLLAIGDGNLLIRLARGEGRRGFPGNARVRRARGDWRSRRWSTC